jgi:succinyl-CoA synthetase alpha subunit
VKSIQIEKDRYVDSVLLMAISRDLKTLPGVRDAVVVLATPANKEALAQTGFLSPELDRAGPNDLAIALDAENGAALEAARAKAKELLSRKGEAPAQEGRPRPATLEQAIRLYPESNLALISVPGAYAAREARLALKKGLHVFLFSDNVSLEDEIALKDEAVSRGLLLMGPGCGTAIVGGKPLGFANVVRRGRIGIVGASGTGIQEVSSLIDRLGGGVSHALGTGGRDLSEAVGGRMALFCLGVLGEDDGTDVLVLISKRPAPAVAERVLAALEAIGKPSVVRFIGDDEKPVRGRITFAQSLADAARLACNQAGVSTMLLGRTEKGLDRIASQEAAGLRKEQTLLRGYFCGGTLAQEAWQILERAKERVFANVAGSPELVIEDEDGVEGHVLLDLGDDRFTRGKPHPMIEPALRDERVARAGEDPRAALVLADLVLGHGAHPNPARGLVDAALKAKRTSRGRGGGLAVVASITGTEGDPQGYSREKKTLEEAGVWVAETNEEAARLAAAILQEIRRRRG